MRTVTTPEDVTVGQKVICSVNVKSNAPKSRKLLFGRIQKIHKRTCLVKFQRGGILPTVRFKSMLKVDSFMTNPRKKLCYIAYGNYVHIGTIVKRTSKFVDVQVNAGERVLEIKKAINNIIRLP